MSVNMAPPTPSTRGQDTVFSYIFLHPIMLQGSCVALFFLLLLDEGEISGVSNFDNMYSRAFFNIFEVVDVFGVIIFSG